MTWQDVLSQLGVLIEPVGPAEVRLTFDNAEAEGLLLMVPYALTPSKVELLPAGPGLVVTARASRAAIEEAARSRWAVVTPSGNADLRGLGLDVVAEAEPAPLRIYDSAHGIRRQGPVPWGSLTAIRRLLAAPGPVTQVQLAFAAGLSQPQVHRALKPLLELDLVKRHRGGFVVSDLSAAVDWWLVRYPGPQGVRSYWTSLDRPTEQAVNLVSAALRGEASSVPGDGDDLPSEVGRVAVSGDAAADLLAPWRRPSQVIVYIERPQSLRASGLVPAASSEHATLVLVSPQDPGVWLPRGWPHLDLPVADPLQVLHDLIQTPGDDSREAAEAWRHAIFTHLRSAWSKAAGYDL